MADSAFSVQADIVTTGSVLHMVTGRILKSLSDGGVDLYAIGATTWLGSQIPVKKSLEQKVRPHLETKSKKARFSFFSNALSIGWGYSIVPLEMSRLQAGSNSLIILSALGTGVSPFQAAELISELLSVLGCRVNEVPNVDVIKSMVAYLTPFVHDLGFATVFEHVTTAARHSWIGQWSADGQRFPRFRQCLEGDGEPSAVAGLLKQIVETARRKERFYISLRWRAAWFAAFASYILGMDVELRAKDVILWAASGTEGKVTFQTDFEYLAPTGRSTSEHKSIRFLQASSNDNTNGDVALRGDTPGNIPLGLSEPQGMLVVDYKLSDALVAETSRYPAFTDHAALIPAIGHAIARLAFSDYYRIAEPPLREGAIQASLEHMGIKIPPDVRGDDNYLEDGRPCGNRPSAGVWYTHAATEALECLDEATALAMDTPCPGGDEHWACRCCSVDEIIKLFAKIALALAPCRYDNMAPGDLRIVPQQVEKAYFRWEDESALDFLALLLDIDFNRPTDTAEHYGRWLGEGTTLVGISGRTCTVYHTFVLDDNCFDNWGRCLSISTGRPSVGGVTRDIIVENNIPSHAGPGLEAHRAPPAATVQRTRLTPGVVIEPCAVESNVRWHARVQRREMDILVEFSLGSRAQLSGSLFVKDRVRELVTDSFGPKNPACSHSHEAGRSWAVPEGTPFSWSGLAGGQDWASHTGEGVHLYGLKGDKMAQALQWGDRAKRDAWDMDYRYFLQADSCLECVVGEATRMTAKIKTPVFVVMG